MSYLQTEDFRQTYLDASDLTDYPTGRLEVEQKIMTVLPGAGDDTMPQVPFIALVATNQTYTGLTNAEHVLAWKRDESNGDKFHVVRDWNYYTLFDTQIAGTISDPYAAGATEIATDLVGVAEYNYFRIGTDPQLYRVLSVVEDQGVATLTFEPELLTDLAQGTLIRVVADHFRAGTQDIASRLRPHSDHEQILILQVKMNLEELQDQVTQLQNLAYPLDFVADTMTLANHLVVGPVKAGFNDATGMIAFDGGHFQGYNGTGWVELDAQGGEGGSLPAGVLGETLWYGNAGWESTDLIALSADTVTLAENTTITAAGVQTLDVGSDSMHTRLFYAGGAINFEELQTGIYCVYTPLLDWLTIGLIASVFEGTSIDEGYVATFAPMALLSGSAHPETLEDLNSGYWRHYGNVLIAAVETEEFPGIADVRLAAERYISFMTDIDDGTGIVAANTTLAQIDCVDGTTTFWTDLIVQDKSLRLEGDSDMWFDARSAYPVGVEDGTIIYHASDGFRVKQAGAWHPIVGDQLTFGAPGEAWSSIHYNPDIAEWAYTNELKIEPIGVRIQKAVIIGARNPEMAEEGGLIEYVNGDFQGIVAGPDGQGTLRVSLTNTSAEQRLPSAELAEGAFLYAAEDDLRRWVWKSSGVTNYDQASNRVLATEFKVGGSSDLGGTIRWNAGSLEWNNGTTWNTFEQDATVPPPLTLGAFMMVDGDSGNKAWAETTAIAIIDNKFVTATVETNMLRLGPDIDGEYFELTAENFQLPAVTMHTLTMALNDDQEEPSINCALGWGSFKTMTVGTLNVTTLNITSDEDDPVGFEMDHLVLVDGSANAKRFVFDPSNLSLDLIFNDVAPLMTWSEDLVTVHGALAIDGPATFGYTVKLNNANDADGEFDSLPDEPGMLRYNGDFQGRLANGQWASFTRTIMDGVLDDTWGSGLWWRGDQWAKNTKVAYNANGAMRMASDVSTPATPGAVRFTGSDFQGCVNVGVWQTLTALEELPSLPSGVGYEGATLRWANDNWVINPNLWSDGVKTNVALLEIDPYENFYDAGYVVRAGGYAVGSSIISVEGLNGPLAIDDQISFVGHDTVYTITARDPIGGPPSTITIDPPLEDTVADREWLRVEGILPRPYAQGGQVRYNQNDYEGFIEGIGWASFTGHRSWLPNRQGDSELNRGNLLYFGGTSWIADHTSFMSEHALVLDKDLDVSGDFSVMGSINANGIIVGAPLDSWENDPVALPGFLYFNKERRRFRGCLDTADAENAPAWIDIVSPIQMVGVPITGQSLFYNRETDYWYNTSLLLINGGKVIDGEVFDDYYSGWVRSELPLYIMDWQLKTEEVQQEGTEDVYQQFRLGHDADPASLGSEFLLFHTASTLGAVSEAAFITTPNFFAPKLILGGSFAAPYLAESQTPEMAQGYDLVVYGEGFIEGQLYMGDGFYVEDGACTINHGNLFLNEGDLILNNGSLETQDVYASGNGFFGGYVRVGYTETSGLLPNGAMRYSHPDNAGRGDWEGWDGTQWVSFTAGFHGQAIWMQDQDVNGGQIPFWDKDYLGGKFTIEDGLTYKAGILEAPLVRASLFDLHPTDDPNLSVGRLAFKDNSLYFALSGGWVDLLRPGNSGLPSGAEDGQVLAWDTDGYAPFSSLKVTADLIEINSVLQLADYSDMPEHQAAAGQVRYNQHDYEGYIPNVGWASFTGRRPMQDAADFEGQFLFSNGANWVATDLISAEGDNLTLGNVDSVVTANGAWNFGWLASESTIIIGGPAISDPVNGMIQNNEGHLETYKDSWRRLTLGANSASRDHGAYFYDEATDSFITTELLGFDTDEAGEPVVLAAANLDVRSGALNFGNSLTDPMFWRFFVGEDNGMHFQLTSEGAVEGLTYSFDVANGALPVIGDTYTVYYKGSVYIFNQSDAIVYRSDDEGATWITAGTRDNFHLQKSNFSLIVYDPTDVTNPRGGVNAKMYMVGGTNGSIYMNKTMWSVDGTTWTEIGTPHVVNGAANPPLIVKHRGSGVTCGFYNASNTTYVTYTSDDLITWTVLNSRITSGPPMVTWHWEGHYYTIDSQGLVSYSANGSGYAGLLRSGVAFPSNWAGYIITIIGERLWFLGGYSGGYITATYYVDLPSVGSNVPLTAFDVKAGPTVGTLGIYDSAKNFTDSRFFQAIDCYNSTDVHALRYLKAEVVLDITGDFMVIGDTGAITLKRNTTAEENFTVEGDTHLHDVDVNGTLHLDGEFQVGNKISMTEAGAEFETGVVVGAVGAPQNLTLHGTLIADEISSNAQSLYADEVISRGYLGVGNTDADGWIGAVRYTGALTCKIRQTSAAGTTMVRLKEVAGTPVVSAPGEVRLILARNAEKFEVVSATDLGTGNWDLVVSPALTVATVVNDEATTLQGGDYEGFDGTQWVSFTHKFGAEGESGLPNGTAIGDTLMWDGTEWVAAGIGLPVGETTGETLRWDGSNWRKTTALMVTDDSIDLVENTTLSGDLVRSATGSNKLWSVFLDAVVDGFEGTYLPPSPGTAASIGSGVNCFLRGIQFGNATGSRYFQTALPLDYNGQALRATFIWASTTAGSGSVAWKCGLASHGDNASPLAPQWSSAIADVYQGASKVHHVTTAAITPTTGTKGGMLGVIVQRSKVGGDGDTFTGTVILIGVRIEYA